MNKVCNREEFISYWGEFFPLRVGIRENTHPLWAGEVYRGFQNEWFVCIRPIFEIDDSDYSRKKEAYWVWCREHLSGKLLCYSSGETNEWWGFTNKDDIVLWLLKWSQ